jgi:hypothetical protein
MFHAFCTFEVRSIERAWCLFDVGITRGKICSPCGELRADAPLGRAYIARGYIAFSKASEALGGGQSSCLDFIEETTIWSHIRGFCTQCRVYRHAPVTGSSSSTRDCAICVLISLTGQLRGTTLCELCALPGPYCGIARTGQSQEASDVAPCYSGFSWYNKTGPKHMCRMCDTFLAHV